MSSRLLKWVGDPPVYRADGWTVANWQYERKRTIALAGFAERIINKSDDPRLSRSYHWQKNLPNFVLDVDENDARVILELCPHEFRDVTDVPDPATVTNTPVILSR